MPPVTSDTVRWYDANAPELARSYEAIRAEQLHAWVADLLPAPGGLALDVGAGTGRDAAWLATRGLDVVAVEPSRAMREQAATLRPGSSVRWIDDSLPELRSVIRTGLSFDLVLASAVWMHVPPGERERAFRKLVTLLKPGGCLAITLRSGPPGDGRAMHAVSPAEIERLARAHGAFVERRVDAADGMGRTGVSWVQMALRLPDDGTGALPLIRHTILNDSKSSTYKLALLRAVGRVADGAAGFARTDEDGFACVPLGLVALYWLRLFKPLLAADLPQSPENRGLARLGFVGDGYRALIGVSHLDLRVGMRFAGDRATALHRALADASRTIVKMPATYLTYPGGNRLESARPSGAPVFPARKFAVRHRPRNALVLDAPTLWSFGELRVPLPLWKAMQRFDAWIEPAIVAEWTRLMHRYAQGQGRTLPAHGLAAATAWIDPARDVRLPRELALRTMTGAPLHCVWTGKRLNERSLDIDHCFPWSAWPCDQLWNLMPAHRDVNQRLKRDRLPGDAALSQARDRIAEWWMRAYLASGEPLAQRFETEARAGLPSIGTTSFGMDEVFDAVRLQRLRLRQDQGIPEWDGNAGPSGISLTRA